MSREQHTTDSHSGDLATFTTARKKGKLRIYFGYAAGVGKTTAMLEDAQKARKDGVDVVVGYIEPPLNPQTKSSIDALEYLPPVQIKNKRISLKELDLDCALERRPQLILVDELAHTNARGCRHKRRYQDVQELLRAGISVYTTLNAQHLESLHDLVAAVTGISVHERIPDSVFDSAEEIVLIDSEPQDLIERLYKGKIYQETQERNALESFYTEDQLFALREIALRREADHSARTSFQDTTEKRSGENRPYCIEHILVCLSGAPSNKRVIRAAASMADTQQSSLTGLYVETSGSDELNSNGSTRLRENLKLAEQFGAQIVTVYGDNIPEQIAQYANASGITKIVMGRATRLKRWFSCSNHADKLIDRVPNLDIHIIPDTQSARRKKNLRTLKPSKLSVSDTLKSLAGLITCTLIGFLFYTLGLSEASIVTIYILGVLLNSLLTSGWLYGLFYSLLSVLAFNYFFVDPSFSLKASGAEYPVTFIVLFAAALITSSLTKSVKSQARKSTEKAYRTDVLLETNRTLERMTNQTDILSETALQLIKLLDRTIIIYAPHNHTLTEPMAFLNSNTTNTSKYLTERERAVAGWVFHNNRQAGATTDTFSSAKCLYLAVRGGDKVLAVVGIAMNLNKQMEPFEKSLMIAMLGECAMALEKLQADQTSRRITLEAQQERLRANLLRAISHDLRTPLTSISGSAEILLNNPKALSEDQKKGLYTDIYEDALWLNNLAENLLTITRIENRTIGLETQAELLSEVIEEALLHLSNTSSQHHIQVDAKNEFLMANMDARLIAQVIINFVNNAITYTHVGSHISISAALDGEDVRVEVADDGPGINDDKKAELFDMFFTIDNPRGDSRRGLGLGLYLCKAIIDIHGGKIYAKDNIPKGTIFGFTLPAKEVEFHE